MGEDEAKASETVDSAASTSDQPQKDKESKKEDSYPNGVVQQHSIIPSLPKTNVTSSDVQNPAAGKDPENSLDRDFVLAKVETEKRLALIKAWEESGKTKLDNKACKKLSKVGLWEDWKKASVHAQLKKIEERMERKKADYVEKMRNKMAEIHQLAEEKRAMIEAQKMEEFLKVEETAAKYRLRGYNPRKFLSCLTT